MRIIATLTPASVNTLTARIGAFRTGIKTAIQLEAVKEVALTKQRIISSKTDPDGIPWRPWSLATIRLYRSMGNPGSLLYRTGALANSMQIQTTDTSAKISAVSTYGKYLQFGTRKMPARLFLGFSVQRIEQIKQTILKEVTK